MVPPPGRVIRKAEAEGPSGGPINAPLAMGPFAQENPRETPRLFHSALESNDRGYVGNETGSSKPRTRDLEQNFRLPGGFLSIFPRFFLSPRPICMGVPLPTLRAPAPPKSLFGPKGKIPAHPKKGPSRKFVSGQNPTGPDGWVGPTRAPPAGHPGRCSWARG